ncbi:MAG: carboxypeptidase-like regulatory domain-containing protein, partial [Bacteroidales bacterium]
SLRMDVVSANYLVNFKKLDSLWFFDYSRTEVIFNAKWKRKWFSNNYTISSEIAVTDISPSERKIEPKNRIRPKDIISNKVNDFTDDNFWEDYNIIEPDQSIDKVIARIIKQLRKRD